MLILECKCKVSVIFLSNSTFCNLSYLINCFRMYLTPDQNVCHNLVNNITKVLYIYALGSSPRVRQHLK